VALHERDPLTMAILTKLVAHTGAPLYRRDAGAFAGSRSRSILKWLKFRNVEI